MFIFLSILAVHVSNMLLNVSIQALEAGEIRNPTLNSSGYIGTDRTETLPKKGE